MSLNEQERKRLLVEQAKNIREYCRDHICDDADDCIFNTPKGCVLCADIPEIWKLPEVEA